ncbi:anthranilate phosphoribosyltransferase [Parageobacillus thermoglucosidasius]|uniref:Anthranilate phosphoribosyltransferase n=3 Tax=Anoxybacillaceae TaxID=3120669 RepID=A0AAN0YQ50_PARTM|nr:anthranilate phosphoribosyltransferase [Parageobacillus thermoglucosidasius]KYD18469.1 Anthranilate phosphoribosyltransferase [Anoxybacillus flavithermus]REK58610.1 MAG: anthranilate phosphoribosyltransferase [Geobacillus sp.]AEH47450.1 anthranilate phosphoribosyltransferase [Parageobacillus thermoglucosidasius C56-YS93]ALF11311.1 anthranilate phosphoribosyltransferase [Parageobacillus thermoglucosidasius]ANZ31388.1 anthranilate phosphoribosyltransferase [Parageobacillus thermoglucosidasius
MFKQLLGKCAEGYKLTEDEAYEAMTAIMSGEATASQIASFLSILRLRGETVDELTGLVKAMRDQMMTLDYEEDVIDTCGTGGDEAATFNISTAAAIVVSSLGVKVAKHGNRAVSSKSGSADVLEALHIDIQATPEEAKQALKTKGLTFLFAPLYHSAMKYAALPRKEIGFRTVFNLIGPLANPARCKRQVIGVYSTSYAEKLAETLHRLGSEHVLFVTGKDGLDECSISAETDIVELKNGEIRRFVLAPEQYGLKRGKLEHIQVRTVQQSAELLKAVMEGKANESATNIVILNAGVALYAAGKAATIGEGVEMAKEAVMTKKAYEQFERLRMKEVEKYA